MEKKENSEQGWMDERMNGWMNEWAVKNGRTGVDG